MKKNRILSFLAAGLLLLTGACSDDPIAKGGATDDESKIVDPTESVYFTVNFDLPSAKSTRSYTDGDNTSNSGTEIGKEYENKVQSVAVVLATNSNEFITYGTSVSVDPVGTTGLSYRTTSKISKTSLAGYYDQDDDLFEKDLVTGNHKVKIYIFCNPTPGLIKQLKVLSEKPSKWYDFTGSWDETKGDIEGENDLIWKENNFLMSNASESTRLIPPTLNEWDAFSSESTPFNFSGMNNFGRPNEVDNLTDRGNIVVERTSARYDFRDGALDGAYIEGSTNRDKTYNGFEPQRYHVVLDSDGEPLVNVFLGKMFMVNMNKNYYYLRRVSNNGRPFDTMTDGNNNNLTLCGPELPWFDNAAGNRIPDPDDDDKYLDGNYVVDAEAVWKYYGTYGNQAPSTGFAEKFNYPFFDEDGVLDNVDATNNRWKTFIIKDVLNGTVTDNTAGWEGPGTHKPYKFLSYLTEGTIPGVESQKNGVSNGLVFKAQMFPDRGPREKDDPYTKRLLESLIVKTTQTDAEVAQNHLIFQYGGHLYCTWEHIRRMAIYLALTDLEKVGDKWTFKINRSLGIYNAVFGTGGFGSVTFNVTGNDAKTANFLIEGPGNATLTDDMTTYPEDPNAPNTKFKAWNHVGGYTADAYYAFRDAVVKSKITIYQESYDEQLGGWAYYCYYYYWNRHNDNGQVGVMCPMEFAVVRNNVYKLAVTKIARLGHPRIVANDPDAPTPNTPDEKADVYLTVTCTTLPWVVRENSIEF